MVGLPLSATFPATLPRGSRYAKSCVWRNLIKYTPEVFHSPQKTRQKSTNVAFGGLLGGPLTAQQSELTALWDELTVDQQQSVLELARFLVSKKHECD